LALPRACGKVPDALQAQEAGLNQNIHATAARLMFATLAGDADPIGVELRRAVHVVANQYDALEDEALRRAGLSGPRWVLLLRLLGEEQLFGRAEVSPTYLSRCLQVSKNTVSALLTGLETQGLVSRSLDPADKRAFHIRLTDAGRAIVRETAPDHVAYLNRLATALTPVERAQLLSLLERLQAGLQASQPGRCLAPDES
jgi:DNA-binding MarR family transcriptional regulator